ncbi:hypothetical protein, partial [Frankia sp. Cj3]|uniref:hypothetical protein n=1 Tax=Frankia sp. Cj3 TaxID=2880976 RepID=UPI001EF45111
MTCDWQGDHHRQGDQRENARIFDSVTEVQHDNARIFDSISEVQRERINRERLAAGSNSAAPSYGPLGPSGS